MKNFKFNLAWIAVLALLSSCSLAPFYIQDGAKHYSRVPASDVKVYASDTLKVRYEVIGNIAVNTMGGAQDAYEYLRQQAASHGANAVISVQLNKFSSYAGRTGCSGVMVRTL